MTTKKKLYLMIVTMKVLLSNTKMYYVLIMTY